MKQSKLLSEFYTVSAEKIPFDGRLDFSFWQPKFNELIDSLANSKYEVVELSSLTSSPITSGTTPENYVFPKTGIMFLGSRNIKNGKLDLTDISHIDESVHNGELKSSKIKKNNVLVTMAGSVGRCAVYDLDYESNISQSVARLKLDHEKIDPQYLVYYLNSLFGQIQFERNKHDVDQPNINTKEIGRIKIIRPPNKPNKKNIQKKIIETVSLLENEIFSLKAKKEKVGKQTRNIILSKLNIKTPIEVRDFYSCFPDNDRLDFIWNQPVTKKIKQYLESMNAQPLGDFIDGDIEYGVNDIGKEKNQIPFVNVENIERDSTINHENIRYIETVPENKLLKKDDLIITRSRTVGVCGYVTKYENGFTFGSFTLRFRIKPERKIHPLYIANFINSELGQAQMIYLQTGSNLNNAQINYLKTGSTMEARGGGNNINPDHLKEFLIIPPQTQNQQKIIDGIIDLIDQRRKIDKDIIKKTDTMKITFKKMLLDNKKSLSS